MDWMRRSTWITAGQLATAAWMVGVLAITDGKVTHPLFDYLFVVPLAGWIAGIAIGRLVAACRDRRDGP